MWVWQGWWPDESVEGQDSNTTGSAVLRFNFARRAALETTLNYCKLKAKAQAKALAAKSYKKVITAFNLFPIVNYGNKKWD